MLRFLILLSFYYFVVCYGAVSDIDSNSKDKESTNNINSNQTKQALDFEINEHKIQELKNLTQIEISQIQVVESINDVWFATFPAKNLKVGEVGIIIRDLESYRVVVADVEIISIDGDLARAKVVPFSQLKQPYLPTPKLTAQQGDKIIFRSYNDKAFLIAPDEMTYNLVKEKYQFVNFISSDLLMGFLNSRGKHDPTKKTLVAACNEYAVGMVFIVGSDTLAAFGCQNLSLIHESDIVTSGVSPQTPFYTRVNFEGGGSLTYLFASKKSRKNYFSYYDSIIKAGRN
ncbi:plasminogen-binding protein pgbA [Helicobacter muridarum]|uniref:Plasminogen binding protein n=1 Tax=Helicobacter muridarum TaxID=216 RepID=A0A377PV44_9HELI|nr:plasminogen-binding N-terminal domain-containing protein [Helicobacter muridarum]TLE01709.1 plasminogen-binding protein pgbA [Helicobacter muridarum]STQ86349.1 plasminogen binding protein [Helicobacter muridarum]